MDNRVERRAKSRQYHSNLYSELQYNPMQQQTQVVSHEIEPSLVFSDKWAFFEHKTKIADCDGDIYTSLSDQVER
jgi:hypothetical protein